MAKDNEFLREKPKDGKDEALRNFVTKMVMLLVVFIGIWTATQRFAKLMGYNPDWVGYPFHIIKLGEKFIYPLYNPFLIFYLMLMYYKQTQMHHLFWAAIKRAGFIWGFSIAFYFVFEFIIKENLRKTFSVPRAGEIKKT